MWNISRASVYRARVEEPVRVARCRPGPVGACSDAELAEHIRHHITGSGFHGEGYRKIWARLRVADVRASRSRSGEIWARLYGVTVNAVIPGLIDTELTRHEERYAQAIEVSGGAPSGKVDRDEANVKQALTRKSPLRVPWIEPEYVAPVVLFLASPEARMVSGATYDATAGDSANYG